jgi:hypothetical protein
MRGRTAKDRLLVKPNGVRWGRYRRNTVVINVPYHLEE